VKQIDAAPTSGAELAKEMFRSITAIGDGRRKTGLKRKPHTRSAWTPERRAKFMQTVTEKYQNLREAFAKSTTDSQPRIGIRMEELPPAADIAAAFPQPNRPADR
jgi:hypothetical protein